MTPATSILLFDGVCNLCNNMVKFVIRYDKKKKFQFAALQSESGHALLVKYKLTEEKLESFVFISDGKSFRKSTATLKVMKELGGAWKILYVFILVPAPIRDYFYTLVAKTRYKIFGKRDVCMVPGKEIAERFITLNTY
jgi:predicted DCC family thiol-disulfide oxidoreductase YuxK